MVFVAPRRVFVALGEGVRRYIARVDEGDVVFTCVCLLLINKTRTCKEPTSILRRCNGATNTLLVATNTLLLTTNTLQWAHGLSEAPGTVLVPPQEGVRSGYTHPPPEPRVEFVPSQEGVRSGYEHPPQHLELRLRLVARLCSSSGALLRTNAFFNESPLGACSRRSCV